jgi:hypothetical protein
MRPTSIIDVHTIAINVTPPMYTFDDPDGNRFYIVEELR